MAKVAHDLALQFRFFGNEIREMRRIHDPDEHEFTRLFNRLGSALGDVFHAGLMPSQIADAMAEFIARRPDFTQALVIPIFGYVHAPNFNPSLAYQIVDKNSSGCSGRFLEIKPGYVALVWPKVFDSIYLEIPAEEQHLDANSFGDPGLDQERFQFLGYYAAACELLADWIDKHHCDGPGATENANNAPSLTDGLHEAESAESAGIKSMPAQYDNPTDLELDAWIYGAKVESDMTWPEVIKSLGKVGPAKKWPPITTDQALRKRLKRYYRAVLGKEYVPRERGNPVNKRKSREKQASVGKPKA